jgi:ABC-type glutathione transport system ATPase component
VKLLSVQDVHKSFCVEHNVFGSSRSEVQALKGVSFEMEALGSVGLAGESGSGKSTLARIIMQFIRPDKGVVSFNPECIGNLRKDVQMVFQNPYASLNPKMNVYETIREPLLIHAIVPKRKSREKSASLLRLVGLSEDLLKRMPSQLSGGQRQRVCIARALATEPALIILDEPVSSLDLTVQLEMLELFNTLKSSLHLTYLFISHNLSVLKMAVQDLIIMKDGVIVEQASADKLFKHPQDAYTRQLLDAASA